MTVSYNQYNQLIEKLMRKIIESKYKPDFILVVASGGFYNGVPIAKALGVPYSVILARHYKENSDSIVDQVEKKVLFSKHIAAFDVDLKKAKRLLVIEDLDDTGDTLHDLMLFLRKILGQTIEMRTAALWHKKSSVFPVDFIADYIDIDSKTNKIPWIVQPHEGLINSLKKKFKL